MITDAKMIDNLTDLAIHLLVEAATYHPDPNRSELFARAREMLKVNNDGERVY